MAGTSPAMTEREFNKQKRPGLSTQPFETLLGESPLPTRPQERGEGDQNLQLAFFTNTGLPTFFWIARFRSSARGDSTSALALSR